MTDYKKADFEKTADTLIEKANARANRPNRILLMNPIILATFGWHMCLPVFLGIISGRFLDKHYPLDYFSWTLNLLILGFAAGLYNAIRWIRRETTPAKLAIKKQKNKEIS